MISRVIYREFKLYMKPRFFLPSILAQPVILLAFFMSSISNVVTEVEFEGIAIQYSAFAIPGIVLLTVMFSSMACAQSIFNERLSNMVTLILASPIKRWHYVIGKILAISLIALLQGALMLLIAIYGFGVKVSLGGLASALAIILIASLIYSSIYIILLTRIRTISGFSSIVNILSMIWLYSAPIFYPLRAIPTYLRPFSYVNPATYLLTLMRMGMYMGVIDPMLTGAILLFALGTILYATKSLERLIRS